MQYIGLEVPAAPGSPGERKYIKFTRGRHEEIGAILPPSSAALSAARCPFHWNACGAFPARPHHRCTVTLPYGVPRRSGPPFTGGCGAHEGTASRALLSAGASPPPHVMLRQQEPLTRTSHTIRPHESTRHHRCRSCFTIAYIMRCIPKHTALHGYITTFLSHASRRPVST